MPTLLQVNVTANWGSTGKIAEQIGLCAQAHDWESYIAYGRMMNPSKNKLIKVGNSFDVYEHYAEGKFLDNEGLASRRATKVFLRQIDAIKPDLIHIHNIHDHWLNYPQLFQYLQSVKTPIVWTFHDCWAFTGHCYHYDSVKCFNWKSGCNSCPRIEKYSRNRSKDNYKLKKELFTSLGERLTIVCVSNWLANEVKESFFHKTRIEVIGNGVNTSKFKITNRNCSSKQKNKYRILAVASAWSEAKGLLDYYQLSKILPSDKYEIVLVGLNKRQLAKLPQRIIGIPKTQNTDQLVDLYNSADVLLSLSKGETFGLTIIEGMACGLPAIIYDNTAQPELISSSTGRIVNNGDIMSVASIIKDLANNIIEFSPENCRAQAVKYYEIDKQYSKYLDLYKSILSQ